MDFKSFLAITSFSVEDIFVELEEIPLASHEQVLLERVDSTLLKFITNRVSNLATDIVNRLGNRISDLPQEEPRLGDPIPGETKELSKFRVTLRYPRSKRKEWLGHYTKGVMYVYADNVSDAKKRVEEYIRNKLEPVENDETRRFPKYNYLKGVKKAHLELNAKKVNSWDDLVAALKHVANTRNELTPLDYFDENDLKIILKAAKKGNFDKLLRKIPPKEQRLLKRFYFHMAQSPWLSQETKLMLDDELTKRMRRLGKIPFEREIGEEDEDTDPLHPTNPEWSYWSIREPKSDKEERELMLGIQKVKDVFDVARRYGIPPNDLRKVKDHLYAEQVTQVENLRTLYRWLRKTIKLSPKSKLFKDTDYANPVLANRYGIAWDEIVDHLMHTKESYAEAFPFKEDETNKASSWLWDFYKNGMPVKPSNLEQWKGALQHVLEYKHRISENPQKVPF